MSSSIDQYDESDHDFKRLYFEYYGVAKRTAIYMLKNEDAAEDIAQNVFLKLWDKRDQLNNLKNPKAYIAQMSRNGALDALKKGANLGEEHIPLEFVDEVEEDLPDRSDIRRALELAVADLSPKCRLVFSLSRFEGLSNPEIAEHLDVSIRTVETQISNALRQFRTDLKHYFIDFLGWGLLIGVDFFDSTTTFFA